MKPLLLTCTLLATTGLFAGSVAATTASPPASTSDAPVASTPTASTQTVTPTKTVAPPQATAPTPTAAPTPAASASKLPAAPTDPVQYITDVLYAPVRAEPNEKSKLVHTGLASGTPIHVLEKDEKTGYAKIRSGDRVEGWIRLQYLNEQAVASVQLEQAAAQIAELQSKNAALEAELTNIKQIAASQIDTHERNTELVKQNQMLLSEKEVLQTDNDRLKDRNNQTWFMYGGSLVLFSTLLATLVPRLAKRRRHDGWR